MGLLGQELYGNGEERRATKDRRTAERREDTNGSISWRGVRWPAVLALVGTLGGVGGGTAWVKAKEPANDIAAEVAALKVENDYIRREFGDMKRTQAEMNGKLDQLIRSDSFRDGRDSAGRRTR